MTAVCLTQKDRRTAGQRQWGSVLSLKEEGGEKQAGKGPWAFPLNPKAP